MFDFIIKIKERKLSKHSKLQEPREKKDLREGKKKKQFTKPFAPGICKKCNTKHYHECLNYAELAFLMSFGYDVEYLNNEDGTMQCRFCKTVVEHS